MKKIVFFDGDGTIWYPKRTRYRKPPWSVYVDKRTRRNPLKHQVLTPHARKVLKYLKSKGIKLAIISTQPDRYKKDRDARLMMKLRHFGISEYFDYVEASKVVARHTKPDTKPKQILKVLRKAHLPRSSALMVGDLYDTDYVQARKLGIDAVLMDGFENSNTYKRHGRAKNRARNLLELLKYI